MNKSILVAFVAIYLPLNLLSAEPSAFGAGDIDNPTPYGLTQKEKLLLHNKQELKQVIVKSNNQANKVDSLRERIDGLQSIVEGISQKSHDNKLSIRSLERKNEEDLKNSSEYEQRLTELTQKNAELISVNDQEIEKVKLLITELSSIIDTINKNYVSKKEFNNLVSDVNSFKDLVIKELKTATKAKKSSSLSGMSNGEIETKAKAFYDKQHYTKSLEYYKYLISKNYKPARSHYMVGEMYYYRKNYAEAIAYFKKSASLYSKASYMPVLMLHTAISMDKTGDSDNAQKFYNAVVSKYPDSKSATIAQEKINNIE